MNRTVSFKAISSEWLLNKEKTVKRTTIAAYTLLIQKHLLPSFITLSEIDSHSVQKFVDEKIKEGISVKTLKDILSVLKMILKYAARKGYKASTSIDIGIPKSYKEVETPVFSLHHHKILLRYIVSHLDYKNLGILICLNTGLRIGEICALQWKDINLLQGNISINKTLYRIYHGKNADKNSELIMSTPKTKASYRTIPLPDSLKKQIGSFSPFSSDDNYILSNSLKPMEPRCYRNHYKKILRELKLPYLKFHGLRHSFATRCIESKCDYKTLSSILGHSNISTTLNLYVHPTQDQKKKCIENMIKIMK